jgi:hypothetical protein
VFTSTTQLATPSTHTTKMRRYYPVSGILLILLIIDFALAVPVLVQENNQARVDVAHIPEEVMTVLEKRGGDPLDLLWDKYFQRLWGNRRSRQPHMRRRTHLRQSPTMGRRTSCRRQRRTQCRQQPIRTMRWWSRRSRRRRQCPRCIKWRGRRSTQGPTIICMGHCSPQRRQRLAWTMD